MTGNDQKMTGNGLKWPKIDVIWGKMTKKFERAVIYSLTLENCYVHFIYGLVILV